MNKFSKKILIAFLTGLFSVCLSFGLAACSGGHGNSTVEEVDNHLATPVISLDVETGIISWDAVENATRYSILKDDEAEALVVTTSYAIDETIPGVYAYTLVASCSDRTFRASAQSNAVIWVVDGEGHGPSGNAHVHTYKYEVFNLDNTQHIKTCKTCDEVMTFELHKYDSEEDTTCDLCEYVRKLHVHEYKYEKKGEEGHTVTCKDGDLEAYDEAHVYDDENDKTCNLCGYEREVAKHEHKYVYTPYDAAFHKVTCEGCSEVNRTSGHVYSSEEDTTCDLCEYERTIVPDETGSDTYATLKVGSTSVTIPASGHTLYASFGDTVLSTGAYALDISSTDTGAFMNTTITIVNGDKTIGGYEGGLAMNAITLKNFDIASGLAITQTGSDSFAATIKLSEVKSEDEGKLVADGPALEVSLPKNSSVQVEFGSNVKNGAKYAIEVHVVYEKNITVKTYVYYSRTKYEQLSIPKAYDAYLEFTADLSYGLLISYSSCNTSLSSYTLSIKLESLGGSTGGGSTGGGDTHTHVYDGCKEKDATYHEIVCECGAVQKSEKHTYDELGFSCTKCGYVKGSSSGGGDSGTTPSVPVEEGKLVANGESVQVTLKDTWGAAGNTTIPYGSNVIDGETYTAKVTLLSGSTSIYFQWGSSAKNSKTVKLSSSQEVDITITADLSYGFYVNAGSNASGKSYTVIVRIIGKAGTSSGGSTGGNTGDTNHTSHDYQYAQLNDTSHTVTCSGCTYSATEAHTYNSNVCTKCGYSNKNSGNTGGNTGGTTGSSYTLKAGESYSCDMSFGSSAGDATVFNLDGFADGTYTLSIEGTLWKSVYVLVDGVPTELINTEGKYVCQITLSGQTSISFYATSGFYAFKITLE